MNIDGKVMKKIVANGGYKEEVLNRLNYAKVIVTETNKELEGSNFESLLKILIQSCEQILA